jgi:hypothetical protein
LLASNYGRTRAVNMSDSPVIFIYISCSDNKAWQLLTKVAETKSSHYIIPITLLWTNIIRLCYRWVRCRDFLCYIAKQKKYKIFSWFHRCRNNRPLTSLSVCQIRWAISYGEKNIITLYLCTIVAFYFSFFLPFYAQNDK